MGREIPEVLQHAGSGPACPGRFTALSFGSPLATGRVLPELRLSVGERLESLKLCLPLLENLHVFHWHPTPEDKCPLEAGASDWKQYLDMARGHARYALLEFFIDDSPDQFLIDAASLNHLLETP